MDLITFGFVALAVAIAGFFVSLVLGIRAAVGHSRERRYVARTARFSLGGSRTAR